MSNSKKILSQKIIRETKYDVIDTTDVNVTSEIHDIMCECYLCTNTNIQMMIEELDAHIHKMREELDTHIQMINEKREAYIQMMNEKREAYIQKYVEQYNKI